MAPETDGPPGAVAIARPLDSGLDANLLIACEPEAVAVCEATARARGLVVLDRSNARACARTVAVEPFQVDTDEADPDADTLLALDHAAVFAVEKVAANREGVYYDWRDMSSALARRRWTGSSTG